jgi:hypothetical protein
MYRIKTPCAIHFNWSSSLKIYRFLFCVGYNWNFYLVPLLTILFCFWHITVLFFSHFSLFRKVVAYWGDIWSFHSSSNFDPFLIELIVLRVFPQIPLTIMGYYLTFSIKLNQTKLASEWPTPSVGFLQYYFMETSCQSTRTYYPTWFDLIWYWM